MSSSSKEEDSIQQIDYNTFQNIKKIDKGGFGEVKRAYAEGLGRQVALKRLYNKEEFSKEVSKRSFHLILLSDSKFYF